MNYENMIVLVDSREQQPWGFSSGVETRRCKLDAGDYSLLGFADRVSVERKHLNDFVNTLIHRRKRFYRELEKLRAFEFRFIVVEADIKDVLDRRYNSAVDPMAVLGLSNGIMVYFNIPVLFCGKRQIACMMVENLFQLLWRRFQSEKRYD